MMEEPSQSLNRHGHGVSSSRAGASTLNPVALLRINDTTEADGSGAVASRRHQQILLVLIQPIGLREIPDRAGGLIGRATSHDCGAGMGITIFVSPLRDVPLQVEYAE